MEVKKMSGLLIGLLGCVLVTNAQNEDLDCKANYKNALYYLQGTDSIQKDSLKAVTLLEACVETSSADGKLLLGQCLRSKLGDGTTISLVHSVEWL